MLSIGKGIYIVKQKKIFYNPEMSSITIQAPAKINLHLAVNGIREDGFHSIRSVFQLVSLHDLLKLTCLEEKGAYYLKGNFNFPEKDNLITRAVLLFRELTGIDAGIGVECRKSIPSGAGLGGGSSDAASVLKGLNILFETGLKDTDMAKAGSRIGSDIPFFFGRGTAVVTGRGENVKPIGTRWDLPVVIVDTGIHVSTRDAYRKLDKIGGSNSLPGIDIETEYLKHPSEWRFYNDFYRVLEPENPVYRRCIEKLEYRSALFSSVSGSGSSVYGIFEDEKTAIYAYRSLKNEFRGVHKGKMLANTPEAVYNSNNN